MVQNSNSAKTCQQSKKIAQFSNTAKTSQQSEKEVTILKQSQNLLTFRKRWYNTQIEPKPVTSQKKDGTILKQSQNL